MEQFDLFGAPVNAAQVPSPPVRAVKMRWSFSRLGFFDSCPRKGYYHYFGASKRKAKTEPNKELIFFLRSLANINILSGDITHRAIRAYLVKAQEGEIWEMSRVISFAY